MYTVYVLRSRRNGRRYIGCTNDLNRRLFEHKNGVSKYTRSTRPYDLTYKEEYGALKEARAREIFLKSGKGREFLKSICK